MKFFFESDILDGALSELMPELSVERAATPECADVTVALALTEEDTVTVTLTDGHAALGGHTVNRLCRALGLLVQALREGKTAYTCSETPLFSLNGAMFDMSRGDVLNVDTLKWIFRRMALMGLNTFMLYTEDTYEVKERPYFGYMRGRYSREELRELDRYAAELGIELIPCIQLLGHLAMHLHWDAAAPYKDTATVMLVGEEETYRFIDDLLRTVSECFTSRRIHIGLDETHDLGRGAYLDRNGYRDPAEIFSEHLSRVADMARGYGLQPMMWSDMFFRLSGRNLDRCLDYDPRVTLLPDIAERASGVQQIFWDYYHPNEDFYTVNLEKHDAFPGETMFAGGVWTFGGFAVQYQRTLQNSIPALHACKEHGTREVIATIWNNGAECSTILSLAGLQVFAEYDYRGEYDAEETAARFGVCGGGKYEDFFTAECVEHPDGGDIHGIARMLLYNDPLTGLCDNHLQKLPLREYYDDCSAKLARLGNGRYAPAFEVLRCLSAVLELKADFGVRLKAAYDAKDRAALTEMRTLCSELSSRIAAMRLAHRTAWEAYNKPFGWEVQDLRYGALLMRFDTVAHRISDYLDGRIAVLEELEEPRLPYQSQPADGFLDFDWVQFPSLFTAGRI